MSIIWSDLRFAFRALRAKPAFTAVAIASLALGIGANTAIFSVVESTLLRHLPYPQPRQLMHVGDRQPCCHDVPLSPGEYLEYKRSNSSFADIAATASQRLTLTDEGEAQRLTGVSVTPNYFDVLGARPELGRLITARIDDPTDGPKSSMRVAVLSDATWRGRFGADPNVIGRDIKINGKVFRVIGVLAPHQESPPDSEIWISSRLIVPEYQEPEALPTGIAGDYSNHWLQVIGRLKPEASPSSARAELRGIAARIAAPHPDQKGHWAVIAPLQDMLVQQVRPAILVLLSAVLALLLIACANIAGLMLARAASRTRELAIRVSIGASRWRIVRLLLSESLLLAGVAGACGIFVSFVALRLIHTYSPYKLPSALTPDLNIPVLAFCIGATLLSAIVCGLVPALNAAHFDVNQGLKESVKGSSSRGAQRTRRILVTGEVALSVILLISACLLIRSFSRLLSVAPGFNPNHVLTAQVSLPRARYFNPAQIVDFWNRLVARTQTQPGVESVALSSDIPLTSVDESGDFEVEGSPIAAGHKAPYANHLYISPEAFRVLQVPLLKGRLFNEHDQLSAKPVVIINQHLADRLFPNRSPVGNHLRAAHDAPWETIIGVVGNVKWDSLDADPPMDIYRSIAQVGYVNSAAIIVRCSSERAGLVASLRRTLRELDPDIPLAKVKSLDTYVDESLGQRRFVLGLLTAFSILAILLAGIGLNAVLAYSVEQRRQEIGIRVALGAFRSDVLWMILKESLVIAGVGLCVGVAGAFWSSSFLRTMLFGVSSADGIAYVAAVSLILMVAVAASLVPAVRAAQVDPISALRYE